MNDVATHFLDAYARRREVEGGWLFGKALLQARLDYSAASLNRLDQLLTAIRTRAKPPADVLRQSPGGRNFCALVAFYVIEMVRRRTLAHLVWHDRASALRVLPPGARLPETEDTRLIALFPDQGVALMPLRWLEARLLDASGGGGTEDPVADMAAQVEHAGPGAWYAGAEAMGRIASWQMMLAADGGAVTPLMLASTAPTTWVALHVPGPDPHDVLARAGRRMEENADGAAWQVLAYDAMTPYEGRQVDAVMVLLRAYGTAPLQMKVAFPYRPAAAGRRFQILHPTLVGANVDAGKISILNAAMERGIQGITWSFGSTWNELRTA